MTTHLSALHAKVIKRRTLTRLPWHVMALTSAALAVGLSACSSSPTAPHVASLPGHQAGHAASGPLTMAQSDRDMIRFADCMRAHGTAMRDPFHRPGHAGLSIDLPPHTQANDAAYRTCTHFIQPIIQYKNAAAASAAAPDLAALTRYASCMRAHDIGMLDPTPQGEVNLGRVPGITNNFGRYSPQFRAADQACRHFLPPGVHDNGTGP